MQRRGEYCEATPRWPATHRSGRPLRSGLPVRLYKDTKYCFCSFTMVFPNPRTRGPGGAAPTEPCVYIIILSVLVKLYLLLAGSSTMIHLRILAHRMSRSRVCTATPFATLEAFYCHAKTFQNTYYCHARNLLLPHRNLSKHISLPRKTPITATPETVDCHAKTFQNTYRCHTPVRLEALYCHAAIYQCHATTTPLPHYAHELMTGPG